MICNDCRPNPGASGRGTELCDHHAEMDRNQVVLEAMIASGEADDKQRRRYALLQAAAILLPKYIEVASAEAAKDEYTHYLRSGPRRIAVTEAIELLTEIEKREPPEAAKG